MAAPTLSELYLELSQVPELERVRFGSEFRRIQAQIEATRTNSRPPLPLPQAAGPAITAEASLRARSGRGTFIRRVRY